MPATHEVKSSHADILLCGQVKQLSTAHSLSTDAAEKVQKELKVLRGTCQQLTHDRMQSITNIRKAESEVSI